MSTVYNENVYLKNNRDALNKFEEIKELRNSILEFEKEEYEDVINKYDLFILEVVDFISKLDFKSSFDVSILISYLINNGYLSDELSFTPCENTRDLLNREGLSIVFGKGCCRNYSSMQKDIMDKMDFEVKKFYCYESDSLLSCKKDEEANHVLNLVSYKENLYGIDLYNNNRLYHFKDKFYLEAISDYVANRLRYKPYCEIIRENQSIDDINNTLKIFKKYSKVKPISPLQYEEYLCDISNRIESYIDKYIDFHEHTKTLKKEMNRSVNGTK